MESSSREQNYWPAFVDALSNVVLTLVFVLVVFVFALVLASNKVERRAQEMIRMAHEDAAKQNDPSGMVAELQQQLKAAQARIEELKKKEEEAVSALEKTTQIKSEDQPGLRVIGSVQISRNNGRIIIDFPKAVSDMDEKSMLAFDAVLAGMAEEIKGKAILIYSYKGLESYSAARRLAYYRVLGIRSHLLLREETKTLPISSQIIEPKEPQDGRIEILFN